MANKKIIIFDDDDGILSICKYILSEDNWEVHCFKECSPRVGRIRNHLMKQLELIIELRIVYIPFR